MLDPPVARSTKTENSDFLSVVKIPRLIWGRKDQNQQPSSMPHIGKGYGLIYI